MLQHPDGKQVKNKFVHTAQDGVLKMSRHNFTVVVGKMHVNMMNYDNTKRKHECKTNALQTHLHGSTTNSHQSRVKEHRNDDTRLSSELTTVQDTQKKKVSPTRSHTAQPSNIKLHA